MKKISVIIVDDERLAREELKRALATYADIDILEEAANADDARLLIEKHNPQLIFLDVQMPEKSGFDLLEMLDAVPLVIFTTAFNQYAVKAFEADALDYLVKPIREERFAKAIDKVRDKLHASPANRQIFIKDGNKCYFVKLAGVHLIESMDNYAVLYFDDKKAFLKRSLNQLEDKLDAAVFFRINRAQLINTTFIKKVEQLPGGKLNITLTTGLMLEASERQSVKFRNKLKV
ncbi:LytR/AlgR family response regulator transcription factor [Mucilaginibacter sp. FT3.2]|uniref:LytR/AlgR family response regulator transcription factor n=1 Tax=Mucilaginibacter sp. FT3.2 TaxID=2723090 RepID=UPI0016167B68|nr:response regulator [Mucilaginibacter sp. FT3.2]MBB6234591.1 two-component system LytT family response regulator [Mucilaginibacter sp. FT3.2]